jgi:hypothetical protein
MSPNLIMKTIKAENFFRKSEGGKYVYIDVWATGVACLQEVPFLQKWKNNIKVKY